MFAALLHTVVCKLLQSEVSSLTATIKPSLLHREVMFQVDHQFLKKLAPTAMPYSKKMFCHSEASACISCLDALSVLHMTG